MKHFVDIEVLREKDEDLGNGLIKRGNAGAFRKGDLISITEKIDGSNASIAYDKDNNVIKAFSRKKELNENDTLDGFYIYVKGLDITNIFGNVEEQNYVIFGEWLRKNKIKYNSECMHKWYVYSIFDKFNEKWLDQTVVKKFCKEHNLLYVHELYWGPFISWEHCRSFCNSPMYGERQEGIVVRDLDALNRVDLRTPHILKIVNDDFKESMKARVREIDPEKEEERQRAFELMSSIVTKNRIEKMLLKLRDEQIIPSELTPEDMGLIAKNLPKRIFDDCLKEEPEIMDACKDYAGKMCGSITMSIVRSIIC